MTAHITFLSPDNVPVHLLSGDVSKLALIDGQLFYYSERFGVVKVTKVEFSK